MTLLATCGLAPLACDVEESEAIGEGEALFGEMDEDELLLLEMGELLFIEDDGTQRVTNTMFADDISGPLSNSGPLASGWDDTVQQGQYRHLTMTKVAGFDYTICIDPSVGDADLYGHYAGYPTKDTYHKRSIQGGIEIDCIKFTATQTGPYYLSVYGFTWSQYHGEIYPW